MPQNCDPASLFDPQGNELNLDYDRGSARLPHAPIIVPSSACYGGRGVIKVHQGMTVDLVLPVVDRTGSPIPLMPVEPVPASSSSSAGSSSSGDPQLVDLMIRFHAKVNETSNTLTVNKLCVVEDSLKGLVRCSLEASDLARPGLQPAQLAIYAPDGSQLYQVVPYWLHVSPTLKHGTDGPLTLAEIRMVVADRCPAGNVLMDALEFDDEEVAIFIRRAVDEFNEKYQPWTTYNCQSFPWRFHWALGAAGNMLRAAAVKIRRNQLAYQAGGVSIEDDNRSRDYREMADDLLNEWHEFIVSKKRTINYTAGFATQLSGYSYLGSYGIR